MNAQDRIDQYVKLRDYKKGADAEFKKSMERVNQALTKLEGELSKDLDASGSDSLAGEKGTVYFKTQSSATVKDRGAFLKFVFESKNLELLDARANKKIVRELGAEGTAVPGVTYTEIRQVGVRRGKES